MDESGRSAREEIALDETVAAQSPERTIDPRTLLLSEAGEVRPSPGSVPELPRISVKGSSGRPVDGALRKVNQRIRQGESRVSLISQLYNMTCMLLAVYLRK